ncbi:MAG: ABC transporter ATP-binding protein [Microbacteriaceae bacterium]|nr:ABC transporter ATP-binding protein [Microbacteriaceae bacterium]
MQDYAIKAEKIRKNYTKTGPDALQTTSLTFRPGELVAVIGHNGAGKSTLFDILAGLIKPSSGTLHRSISASEIGWCPQREIIDWSLTVRQNIMLGLNLRARSFRPNSEISELVDLLGLARFIDRTVEGLSGGELRRTQIARAMAGNPAFIMLDEPTTGLDPDGVRAVFEHLQQRVQAGATALVTTHETSRFAQYCNRVVALHRGEVIADLPAVEFVQHSSEDGDNLWSAYRAIIAERESEQA